MKNCVKKFKGLKKDLRMKFCFEIEKLRGFMLEIMNFFLKKRNWSFWMREMFCYWFLKYSKKNLRSWGFLEMKWVLVKGIWFWSWNFCKKRIWNWKLMFFRLRIWCKLIESCVEKLMKVRFWDKNLSELIMRKKSWMINWKIWYMKK